jgi:putative nucleotidyltransferase with HDIG domain
MIGPQPSPPDWHVDWDTLARLPFVAALAGCVQDPHHHAEGDVFIHTRMVLDALVALPAFRSLEADSRAIVFAAALLHDVAKPATTREIDGKITARGHSLKGANMARQILWRLNAPFLAREAVCHIIRHHQVPFFLIEQDNARRRAIEISQRVRCDLLALVTEADARGRHCTDPQHLLDNVELFRAFCDEHACLTQPYAFATDHARFHYMTSGTDPSYVPHESFRSQVILLSGLPGAGKNTWIQNHAPDWPVVSLDDLRRTLDVDPSDHQAPIIDAARALARDHLRAHRNFIWNATNLSRSLRGPLISLFSDYGARVRIVYVESPADSLFSQNKDRESMVPTAVIERLLDKWDVPDRTEAHEVTYAVDGDGV